jgi:putative transposase
MSNRQLCVNAGKQVLAAMMEADRVAVCGANNVPNASRKAVRGGTTRSSVVLGGQRIAITKPRARSLQRGELELPTFAWAAHTDPLDMATLASLAAGVSTRRYAGTLDKLPEPDEALSVSKSAVSRRWVALSQAQLHEWLCGSIKELDLPVVMIDGIHFRDRVILVALGIDAQGNKHVLGLREGSTEASRVVRSLLSVGAGVKVFQISRFESAHGSSRRATRARSDVGQGLTSLSPLVAGMAARMALAVEEILAELDQEPRGGRQVIL